MEHYVFISTLKDGVVLSSFIFFHGTFWNLLGLFQLLFIAQICYIFSFIDLHALQYSCPNMPESSSSIIVFHVSFLDLFVSIFSYFHFSLHCFITISFLDCFLYFLGQFLVPSMHFLLSCLISSLHLYTFFLLPIKDFHLEKIALILRSLNCWWFNVCSSCVVSLSFTVKYSIYFSYFQFLRSNL